MNEYEIIDLGNIDIVNNKLTKAEKELLSTTAELQKMKDELRATNDNLELNKKELSDLKKEYSSLKIRHTITKSQLSNTDNTCRNRYKKGRTVTTTTKYGAVSTYTL